MKKIVGIIAAAALAGAAFAEVNIGSWSRGAFLPVATDGDGNVNAGEGANWDNDASKYGVRTGLGFSASSENAGVVFDVFGNAGTGGEEIGIGDNAYVWVKPIEVLRVAFGQVDNSWGRTDVCFGNYDHAMRYVKLPDGEGIGAWRDHYGTGVNITLQPVEGLVIDYQGGFGAAGERTYKTLYHHADVMIGYQADFGFIRAIIAPQNPKTSFEVNTSTGGISAEDYEWLKIGLGADITAIENLTITAGVTVPTDFHVGYTAANATYTLDKYTKTGVTTKLVTDSDKASFSLPEIQFGAGAHYNLDPITLHGFVIGKLIAADVDADGTAKFDTFAAGVAVGLDFAINDTFSVITDFRFTTEGYSTEWSFSGTSKTTTKSDFGFGAYAGLEQKLTNATFDFGVLLANQKNGYAAADDGVTFAVPLMITTSF